MGRSAIKTKRVYTNLSEELVAEFEQEARELKLNVYDLYKLALAEWMKQKRQSKGSLTGEKK